MKKRLVLLAVLTFIAVDSASPVLHNHAILPVADRAAASLDAGHPGHGHAVGENHGICFICLFSGNFHSDGAFSRPVSCHAGDDQSPTGEPRVLGSSARPGGPGPRAPPSSHRS